MDRITHKVRREQWLSIINECLSSGMSKTSWCRERGISDKSFIYWQRKVREDTYISTIESSSLPAVNDISVPVEIPVDFVEVKIPEPSSSAASVFRPDIIIRKNSFFLEISNPASAELRSRIGGLLYAE